MTSPALILLVIAGGLAVVDWWAVAHRPSSLEAVCKPAVMVALVGVALAVHPEHGAQRWWFVAALVLSLAGDVFLLPKPDAFVPGLASFLLAHLAYIAGFAAAGRGGGSLVPLVFVLAGLSLTARQVLGGVARHERELLGPVVVYILVISGMVAASYVHGDLVGIVGAILFAMSDSILATERFVQSRPWMPLAVMVTYHLAQALLVVSLVP
jgi:uncharacterized membrane protein YhhN